MKYCIEVGGDKPSFLKREDDEFDLKIEKEKRSRKDGGKSKRRQNKVSIIHYVILLLLYYQCTCVLGCSLWSRRKEEIFEKEHC